MTWNKHLYLRTCELCGNEFETYNPAQKYCSPDCAATDSKRRENESHLRSKYRHDVHVTGKLADKILLAAQDGLSYGKSRAMRERGAVFA